MHKIEDILQQEGYYISTSVGNSMLPFLRDRTDTIIIKKSTYYKKFDVVLYKSKDKYILHRIISISKDIYHIRGDNCYYDEYIPSKDIIGVMSECYRGEHRVNLNGILYKLYVYYRVYLYPIRLLIKKILHKLKQ